MSPKLSLLLLSLMLLGVGCAKNEIIIDRNVRVPQCQTEWQSSIHSDKNEICVWPVTICIWDDGNTDWLIPPSCAPIVGTSNEAIALAAGSAQDKYNDSLADKQKLEKTLKKQEAIANIYLNHCLDDVGALKNPLPFGCVNLSHADWISN